MASRGLHTAAQSRRKILDLTTCFGSGNRQVVPCLEGHPVFRIVTEPVSETERRIACDGALAVDDLGDPVGRDAELTRKLGRRHADGFKLLGEDLARVMVGANV